MTGRTKSPIGSERSACGHGTTQAVYTFEQIGMTTDLANKNIHMRVRFYIKASKLKSLQARWQRRHAESPSLTRTVRMWSFMTTDTSSCHTWPAVRTLKSILTRSLNVIYDLAAI